MTNENTAAPITAKEAAAQLDGNQYRQEGSRELFKRMKAAGLVAIFGASDDLMEIHGAVNDETGGEAWFTPEGMLENDCDNDRCPHFLKLKKQAASVEALWCKEPPFSFTYKTDIPHETFIIMEDDEPYCRGIVFALADVGKKATVSEEGQLGLAIRLWSATGPRGGENAWEALPAEMREHWMMIAGFASMCVRGPLDQHPEREKAWEDLSPEARARWLSFMGLEVASQGAGL